MFYDNRLHSLPGLEKQIIKSPSAAQGSGLMFLPVIHEGNQSSSQEEADRIQQLVAAILDSKATWIDLLAKLLASAPPIPL